LKYPIQKRFYVVVGVLVFSSLLSAFYLYPRKSIPRAKYAKNLPMELPLGMWKAEELEILQYEIDILETDDLISRIYSRVGEESIYMSVVFAQENRKVAHPPEVCLRGLGWEVESKEVISIVAGFKVIQLVVTNGMSRELYYYYFKAGDNFTENYLLQQINVVLSHIFQQKGSASLIRVQTRITGGDILKAKERLNEFSLEMRPYIEKTLP